MSWPRLPPRAAYLAFSNPQRRNALSLAVLRDLRSQLLRYNTSPADGRLRVLPPFQPALLAELEVAQRRSGSGEKAAAVDDEYAWLVDAEAWARHRGGLPKVLVLRPPPDSSGVFSAGHDLAELAGMKGGGGDDEARETFVTCAEVMGLIRRSPAVVVSVVEGLATAAGMQLALSADVAIASAERARFQLPEAMIGLPCTAPAVAVSRRLGDAFTGRMLVTGEAVRAGELPGGGGVEVVEEGEAVDAVQRRVDEVVGKVVGRGGMPAALGKWAFWTQAGLDGYEDALGWAGRMMALHARSADAREGMEAFVGKREMRPVT